MKLSRRAAAVQPSPTLAITARARALADQGIDVVSFGAGEPDFDTPQHVKDAAARALAAGFTRYTNTAGIVELRAAIAAKHRKENALDYDESEIVVTAGAKHALYEFFQAIVDPGDEVIVPSPYWVSYPDMVRLAGGVPVFVETKAEEGFVPSPDAIRSALTPRTVAVVLNSPSNPTGAVWSREALEGIAAALEGHSCWIVSDDIYEHLIYTGQPFLNVLNVAPELRDRTVVVNGLSKSFAMTGWRIGWAAGPRAVIGAMQKIQDQSTSNINSITQKAAIAALEGGNACGEEMRRKFDERRRYVTERFAAMEGVHLPPIGGAFYAFPDLRALCAKRYKGAPVGDDVRLAAILLDDFRVAVVPGSAFGAPGFVRLSFAASMEQLEKGLNRIAAFVSELE